MSAIDTAGIHIALPRTAREPSLTPRQNLRRRNAFWLFWSTTPIYDPALGRPHRATTEELANLFGVSPRTVQLGIASARRVRTQCEALKSA